MLSRKMVIVSVALLGFLAATQAHSQDAAWVRENAVHATDSDSWGDKHDVNHPVPMQSHEDSHGSRSNIERCRCENCHAKAEHGVSEDAGHPSKPKRKQPGDVSRGDNPPFRYSLNNCQRAGKPHSVAPWAKCGTSKKYSVGFVGGGSGVGRVRGRTTQEGTWGMDYNGFFGLSTVWLDYTRGRHHAGRKQGGEGAYRTDGEPAIVSKVSALKKNVSSKVHR